MPSEDTDERRLSPLHAPSMNPSYLTDEIRFPTERQVGFWKHASVPDHDGTEGMPLLHGGRHFIPLPLEKKLDLSSANPAGSLDSLQSHFLEEQKTKFSFEELVAARRIIGIHSTPWKHASSDFGHKSDLLIQPTNIYTKGNTVDPNVVHYENCLFSSSFSETFNRKVSLASDDAFFCNSTDTIRLNFEEDVLPFGSLKEIEAQTIGDLLPDDDDLLEHIVQPSIRDDAEDDIFCTVGGIEIEEVDSSGSFNASDIPDETSYAQQGELNCSSVGEHPYGERPSRTLFVRNINSNVEDAELRNLFEKYGDIRTLYAVCKHRGFVMISYFDIRSACNAMRELQNMPLRHRKLDIHFSIPKSNPSEKDINQGTLVVLNLEPFVSDGDLRQIFGVHGEIKEICEVPQKNDLKLIEFYDIRATEAAVNALNMSYIAEKQIKVEPFHRGVARQCMMQQRPPELQQDKIGRICNQSYPKNSPSGYGSISMGTSTFNNHDFGSVQGLNSVSQAPFSSIVVNKFNRIPSNSPHDFFPSRSGPIGNHSNQSFINSPGQKNDDFFDPHSLPQYHDKQSIPYNMESSTSAKAINIARSLESVGNRCMSVNSVSSSGFGGQNYGHSERAFGASGNSSYPASWHEYAWNNSFRSPSGTAIWPRSPSFTNNIPCLPSTELYGFPRAIHMLNTVFPATQYHVGSAPTADLSIWNRHQAYEVNPTDTSVFHPGSLGSKDFSSSPISNTNEHVSHNIFPHVSRTFMDPPMTAVHVGLPPPQQSCHIFYGREDMNSMPDAFNAHRDRVRCRRSDTSSNQADNKKEYELEIERIISGEDCRTTLMIKNIPNRYTSKMLLAAIDEHHRGTYDFIYLPIDFKNKCNVGYAFINMNDPLQIVPFHKTFSGKKWEKFNSEKVASLAYARIQGKAALVAHFQNSSLMNEDRRCRPIIFHSDGPNAGEQEPFPTGINIRSRPARSRSHKNEDDHDDVPSNSATDEISTGVIPSGPTIA